MIQGPIVSEPLTVADLGGKPQTWSPRVKPRDPHTETQEEG
jgi:hypothetical protein